MSKGKFQVGLVQMAMSADPRDNEERAAAGVEEAARLYFGKSVREVTLSEAAMLKRAPIQPHTMS